MVAIFGFGPLAGFITLSFATIGFLSKLLAEDIESMDKAQAEAVKATGASWLQWINYAVQPQVMPRLIGLSMYRLDINFRESAVLGLVGAGGIGATLNTAFDRYEFDTAAAIIITISTGVQLKRHKRLGTIMDTTPVWRRRTQKKQLLIWFGWLLLVAIFVSCWMYISNRTEWFFVLDTFSTVPHHRAGATWKSFGNHCGILSMWQPSVQHYH